MNLAEEGRQLICNPFWPTITLFVCNHLYSQWFNHDASERKCRNPIFTSDEGGGWRRGLERGRNGIEKKRWGENERWKEWDRIRKEELRSDVKVDDVWSEENVKVKWRNGNGRNLVQNMEKAWNSQYFLILCDQLRLRSFFWSSITVYFWVVFRCSV